MKSVNSQLTQEAKYSYSKNFALLNFSVLSFAITVIIPLSLGITRLPFTISLPIFVSGFISLFWLARQKDKKLSYKNDAKTDNFENYHDWKRRNPTHTEEEQERFDIEYEVPLELVRDHMEKMLSLYTEYIDNATKKKLIDLCKQLEKIN